MRLVLASNNAGKLAELQALFAALPLTLVSQRELGIAEAAEPHVTFIENALAKARHAARASGGAAIADDSGLCVDALGGLPGVGSAHFADLAAAGTPAGAGAAAADAAHAADEGRLAAAGHGNGAVAGITATTTAATTAAPPQHREALRRRQDAANNALLLSRLHGTADRRAAFVCTLVAVRHADDPEPLVACGRWPGRVAEQPQGDAGFGYDPLLFIGELGATVAQLGAAAKNLHSHRARAAAQMRALLADAWHLG